MNLDVIIGPLCVTTGNISADLKTFHASALCDIFDKYELCVEALVPEGKRDERASLSSFNLLLPAAFIKSQHTHLLNLILILVSDLVAKSHMSDILKYVI